MKRFENAKCDDKRRSHDLFRAFIKKRRYGTSLACDGLPQALLHDQYEELSENVKNVNFFLFPPLQTLIRKK